MSSPRTDFGTMASSVVPEDVGVTVAVKSLEDRTFTLERDPTELGNGVTTADSVVCSEYMNEVCSEKVHELNLYQLNLSIEYRHQCIQYQLNVFLYMHVYHGTATGERSPTYTVTPCMCTMVQLQEKGVPLTL